MDLVGLCDPDAEALARATERWSVPETFDDVAALLDATHPDLLSVCAPPSEHLAILRLALEAGVKGVLLEKPVAPDLAAAREAVELVKGSSTRVAVNYTRRFPPAYREAIDAIRDGSIGNIQQAYGIYTKGVVNNGSHMIDLLRAMLGEPEIVVAMSDDGAANDSTVSARLGFAGGAEAWMAAADGGAFNVFDLDILGTEGRISFTDLGHSVQRWAVADTAEEFGFKQLGQPVQAEPTELGDAIRYAIDDLIGSIETGREPLCTIDDGYAALAIALRLRDGDE